MPTKIDMDVGTLVGCTLGGLLILCALMFSGHEGLLPFINTPALLIVFGCMVAAVLIAFPLKPIASALRSIKKCFATSQAEPNAIIDEIVSFAESTRRGGLLAQESRLGEIHDPFLAEGLRLVVDGLPPATVENILSDDIEAMRHRHQQGRNVILHCGKCAPAFGMVGTLIGLVLMLTNLDAETVGPGMAVAVLTTLYAIVATHLVFLPIAEKLKQLHEAEVRIKTMMIRGVLAIQSGEHPRIIQMKLLTFLPPDERSEERISGTNDIPTIPLSAEEDVDREETKQAA
jgi:chemotaxis protein MotA